MDNEEDSVFELGFEIVHIDDMPKGRLADIMKVLIEKDQSVLTLDSLIFNRETMKNEATLKFSFRIFQTFLYNIKPSIKTLSLRYNILPQAAQDYLIEWVTQNDWIEVLYLQVY